MNFITISEMIGTEGEKIAKELAKKMDYYFVGDKEIYKAASALGIIAETGKIEEKAPSLIERIFSERPKAYLDKFQAVLYELAQKGNTVFFGGGAQILLQSFDCAFHVLVVGSMEQRSRRIMEDKKISKDVAEKIVKQSDNNKASFLKFAFNEDWLNWKLYDLVINTDKLNSATAVKIIMEGATSSEIKACGIDSVRSLEQLSIRRRIEAALIETGIRSANIFYELEADNTLRIYGVVYSLIDKEEIEKTISQIASGVKIKNDLLVYPGTLGTT